MRRERVPWLDLLPWVVSALVLCVALAGFANIEATRRHLIGRNGEELAREAEAIRDRIDFYLTERLGDLRMISGLRYAAGEPLDDVSRWLAHMLEAYPFYEWVGLVSADGSLLWQSDPANTPALASDRAWIAEAASGPHIRIAGDGGARMLLAASVADTAGNRSAVVIARCPLPLGDRLGVWEETGSRPLRRDLFNAEGRLGGSGKTGENDPEPLPALPRERGAHPGYFEETDPATGRRLIAGYATTAGVEGFAGSPWTVRVAMDRETALARTNRFMLGVRLGSAAILLPVGCFSLWSAARLRQTTRDIARRERNLQRQYDALAQLAHSPAVRQGDETGAYRLLATLASGALGVARSSIWFYCGEREGIVCAELFDRRTGEHAAGQKLLAEENPAYFKALATGRTIAAEDARSDPATREFGPGYLEPTGIGSMLDAPVWSGGKLIGVLCNEHVGGPRAWSVEEQSFAAAAADLISLTRETAQHRLAQEALREARDSLERKVEERTRELAEANGRLSELDRLKSEFLATMSHELRTPLNSIIGFTGILEKELAGPLTPEQKKQLGMVHFSAKHLLDLINGLLDLSRIESGRMEVHRERFPLRDVVQDVAKCLDPLAARKGITLETETDPSAGEVFSDRKKVFQILLNLANNAVKFTERGAVRIRARTLPDDRFRIEVEDTGIGIRADQLPNLFTAFRQADGSARRVYEGTGLGLYLSKKLCALLGGEIDARSEPGKGSLFGFALPSPPAEPATPPAHNTAATA